MAAGMILSKTVLVAMPRCIYSTPSINLQMSQLYFLGNSFVANVGHLLTADAIAAGVGSTCSRDAFKNITGLEESFSFQVRYQVRLCVGLKKKALLPAAKGIKVSDV
jgi:hypothetical protein